MRSACLALLALVVLTGGSGCYSWNQFLNGRHADNCQGGDCGHGHGHGAHGCQHCGGRGCAHCGHGHGQGHAPYVGPPGSEYVGPAQGQATGAVSYPYYTTRGPRDFLLNEPPTIGR